MKYLIALALLSLSTLSFAGPREEQQVAKLMNGKDLVCKPQKKPPGRLDGYRGDEGYFRLTIDKKKGLTVTDNGGSGYGFANGGINDLIIRKSKMYLEVGDDGYQTLIFDFDQIGGSSEFKDNCSSGAIVDYSSGYFLGESFVVVCCLE